MNHPDLTPAAATLARLVAGVRDDQLTDPTPCVGTPVAGLLDHIGGLALAFDIAARRAFDELPGDAAPVADAAALDPEWRTTIPKALGRCAAAWLPSEAWEGTTQAGSVDLPGEVCGLVALDEIVIHGWDLAVATGQSFDVDDASLQAVHDFVEGFEPPPGGPADSGQLFGPEVAVAADTPLLAKTLGKTGRNPAWSP